MPVYLDLVMLLNFLVDLFLMLGTNRLAGYPAGFLRAAAAALLGSFYAGACLLPGFAFLGSTLWRGVSLGLMAVIAFGVKRGAVRRSVLFLLLSMALGGIATGLGDGGFWALTAAAAGVCGLCAFGFRGTVGVRKYVPVELRYGTNAVCLTALRDTGNTLRDPVTGESVLVAGAEAAQALLGLSQNQLRDPVQTLAQGTVPGLRLIPYRAVGKESGMLLALRIEDAKVGTEKTSALVAFAPESIGGRWGEYQALTGGVL